VFEQPFWKQNDTQGRITKPRIDFFLAHSLSAQQGKANSPGIGGCCVRAASGHAAAAPAMSVIKSRRVESRTGAVAWAYGNTQADAQSRAPGRANRTYGFATSQSDLNGSLADHRTGCRCR
jgi:hypothetical protein